MHPPEAETLAMHMPTSNAPQTADTHIEQLLQAIRSKDPRSRTAAAEKLGALGQGTTELRSALQDPNPYVRSAAARALGNPAHADRDGTVDELFSCIHDSNDHVAAAAIYALGNLGAKEGSAEIASYLDTSSRGIRLAVVRALGQLDARHHAPAIAALLTGRDPKLLSFAIEALRRMDYRESAPRILEILRECLDQSTADLIINNAIHALGAFGYNESIPTLVEIALTRFGHRTHAVRALVRLKAHNVAPELIGLYQESTAMLPQVLTELMIAADYRPALPQVRRLLHHAVPQTRLIALKAVAHWTDAQAGHQLRFMALHESDMLIRTQAMAIHHEINPRVAERDLLELVKGQRVDLARVASEMLSATGVFADEVHEELKSLAQRIGDHEVKENLERTGLRRDADDAQPDSQAGSSLTVGREAVLAYLNEWSRALSASATRDGPTANLHDSIDTVLRALNDPAQGELVRRGRSQDAA